MEKKLILLVAMFFSPILFAEDCTLIHNEEKRLACYDKAFGYTGAVSVPDSGTGDWGINTKTSDIDDSTNVYIGIQSYEQTNCPYKEGQHELLIACRENTTALILRFADCFMSSIQGKGKITYRLDKEKAKTKGFVESNDNMALGLWNGGSSIPFIKSLFGHDELLIKATPFSDSPVTAKYKITGLENAIKPLRKSCGW